MPGSQPFRSVAVIGAGLRGRAFAFRCLHAGFAVTLEDVLSSNLRQAAQQVQEEAQSAQSRLQLVRSVEDAVRQADVAIDFVPDELESKLEILSMMDRMAPPKTVFCSPTSLSISDLASCTYRADRCVAMQPFEDDSVALEVIRGRATSDTTLQRTVRWLESLGTAVQVTADLHPPQAGF